MENIRPVDVLAKEFNEIIKQLLTKLSSKSRSEDEIARIKRLKDQLILFKRASADMGPIDVAAPLFLSFKDKIQVETMDQREEFFLNLDIREEAKKRDYAIKKEHEFLLTIINSIKNHWRKAPPEEKEQVYNYVKTLLTCSVEYLMQTKTEDELKQMVKKLQET